MAQNDPITKSGKLYAEKFGGSTHPRTPRPSRRDPNPEYTPSQSSRARDPEGFLASEVQLPTPRRVNIWDTSNFANDKKVAGIIPISNTVVNERIHYQPSSNSLEEWMAKNKAEKLPRLENEHNWMRSPTHSTTTVDDHRHSNIATDDLIVSESLNNHDGDNGGVVSNNTAKQVVEWGEKRRSSNFSDDDIDDDDGDSTQRVRTYAGDHYSKNVNSSNGGHCDDNKQAAEAILLMASPTSRSTSEMKSSSPLPPALQPKSMSAMLDDSTVMIPASKVTTEEQVTPLSVVAEVESNNTYHKNMSSKINNPPLSDEEEATATKYRNMLKYGVPKDNVRLEMMRGGIENRIVEAVLGKDALEGTGSDSALSQPTSKNSKTVGLHWIAPNLAPELLKQSIFGGTQLALVNLEESDMRKLEEIFPKRTNSNTVKTKSGSHKNNMAKLLGLTRAQNIEISLKSFNDFTFQSLAETIGDLDPECRIVGERVQFLPNLLPTPQEMQSIKSYKGDDEKLFTAELFFRHLVSIKRIEDKVRVMQAMSSFDEHIDEVRAGLKTLQEVCSQVINSEKLIQVLETVRIVGNVMNAGTLHGGVAAFKFESLRELSETKSADGETTVLDCIVEMFIKKGERQALFLLTEFPTIQDSSCLSIGELMEDMISLHNDSMLCTKELLNMKRDQRSAGGTKSSTKVVKESEKDDPRKALFSDISSRGSKEDDRSTQPPDPRKALFAAIRKRNADNGEENVDDSPDPEVKYSPGVNRLQRFLIHSKSFLSNADNDIDSAIQACKHLALYCGEDGGERAAASLLQVLSSFALSLESGVKKYDQRVEADKKRAARKNDVKGKENNHKVNSVSTTRLLKSSSLQCTLPKHIGDIIIAPDESQGLMVGRVLSMVSPSAKEDNILDPDLEKAQEKVYDTGGEEECTKVMESNTKLSS